MKTLLYGGLLVAVLLIPIQGTDVGRLIPVEVIAVSENEGTMTVETDTGDRGRGDTLEEAFDQMKERAPGVIYLDTAEYLILEKGMEAHVTGLRLYLKDNIQVCCGREGITLEGIADFLSVHRPGVKLEQVINGDQIPTITEENGQYQLFEK